METSAPVARSIAGAALRHRRAELLGLALIAGLAAGTMGALAAGAHRASTLVERLGAASDAAHAVVHLRGQDPTLLEEIRRLPEVAVAARFVVVSADPVRDIEEVASRPELVVALDTALGHSVDRGRLLAGTRPAPDDPVGVAVTERIASQRGLHVGDDLGLFTLTSEQLSSARTGEPIVGGTREIHVQVASIERFYEDSLGVEQRGIRASPAFWDRHGAVLAPMEQGLAVRLRGGRSDLPAFEARVRSLQVESATAAAVTIESTGIADAPVESSGRAVAIGLIVATIAVGLMSTVLAGELLARLSRQLSADWLTLRALGCTRRQQWGASMLSLAPAVVGGAVLSPAVALALSPFFPMGRLRRAEPDPGFSCDVWVLSATVAVVLLLGVGACAILARPRPTRVVCGGGSWPRSTSDHLVRRLPPMARVGARFALPGNKAARGSGKLAPIGAVIGVIGVAGAIVFGSGLERFVAAPPRDGWAWDVAIGVGEDLSLTGARLAAHGVLDDPDIDAATLLVDGETLIRGRRIALAAFEGIGGPTTFAMIAGRAPRAPDEVALAPRTRDDLGAQVGGSVALPSQAGGSASFRVVGVLRLPALISEVADDGVLTTAEGAARLGPVKGRPLVLATVRSGAARDLFALRGRFPFIFDYRPSNDVLSLSELQGLPTVMALVLGTMGLAAVTGELLGTSTRRRVDLLTLRALGASPRQLNALVIAQGLALALAGLLVGLPMGIAAGRVAWSVVAAGTGIAADPLTPASVLLIVPTTLAVVGVAAAMPARFAAKSRGSRQIERIIDLDRQAGG